MAATIEFMLGQLTACCVVFLVLRFGSIGAAFVFCFLGLVFSFLLYRVCPLVSVLSLL
jgi:hypothetical protein